MKAVKTPAEVKLPPKKTIGELFAEIAGLQHRQTIFLELEKYLLNYVDSDESPAEMTMATGADCMIPVIPQEVFLRISTEMRNSALKAQEEIIRLKGSEVK